MIWSRVSQHIWLCREIENRRYEMLVTGADLCHFRMRRRDEKSGLFDNDHHCQPTDQLDPIPSMLSFSPFAELWVAGFSRKPPELGTIWLCASPTSFGACSR